MTSSLHVHYIGNPIPSCHATLHTQVQIGTTNVTRVHNISQNVFFLSFFRSALTAVKICIEEMHQKFLSGWRSDRLGRSDRKNLSVVGPDTDRKKLVGSDRQTDTVGCRSEKKLCRLSVGRFRSEFPVGRESRPTGRCPTLIIIDITSSLALEMNMY